MSAQNARMSKTSRAIAYARAMSEGDAPVSCCMRKANVEPARSTMLLVTCVAMISRRRRWRRICSEKRSGSGAGK